MDITQDVKYLIENYDPKRRLYSIVHFNQAVAKYAHGWREDAEFLQRDGTILKVMSRPRVADDTPLPVLIDETPEAAPQAAVVEEDRGEPPKAPEPKVSVSPRLPETRPSDMPEGWEILQDEEALTTTLTFLQRLRARFSGDSRG